MTLALGALGAGGAVVTWLQVVASRRKAIAEAEVGLAGVAKEVVIDQIEHLSKQIEAWEARHRRCEERCERLTRMVLDLREAMLKAGLNVPEMGAD